MEPKLRAERKPRGKRAELDAWLRRELVSEIGQAEWAALRRELAPVSDGHLRKLLRESGVRLVPLVEGVRQESLETLEASLLALLEEFERGDRAQQTAVRKLVIEAKDHARWAMKNPEKREIKEEMVLWMLTWLENPSLFRDWVALRKRAMRHGDPET